MMITQQQTYTIRTYKPEDANRIGALSKINELAYGYNRDLHKENIFVGENTNGDLTGVGHLEPLDDWDTLSNLDQENTSYRLRMDLAFSKELKLPTTFKDQLIQLLLKRGLDIQKQHSDKDIRIVFWTHPEDHKQMDALLHLGFNVSDTILVMNYDLTKEVPTVEKPKGIRILSDTLKTKEDIEAYHHIATTAFNGKYRTLNCLSWMLGNPSLYDISAYMEDALVGSSLTWGLDEHKNVTEEIFITSPHRRKGIGKYMISQALKLLKAEGKTEATLTVSGGNKAALALYLSLGYKFKDILLEQEYSLGRS